MTQQTKMETIGKVLMVRPLNRFEAERIGDHCLNTTISDLSKQGWEFDREWETVPNRWGGETRVKRYRAIYWPPHWKQKRSASD